MIEPINPPTIDEIRRKQILDKVMPDVMGLLEEFKTQIGGVLPEELSYGIVAGYLHGRGHTWEESFVAMHQWINVVKKHHANALVSSEGTLTVKGTGNQAMFSVEPKK